MNARERLRSWRKALGAAAKVRDAVRSLRAAKQRSALALIGIVLGIGSVIAMISVGMSAKVEALGQFRELGTDILTVTKVGRCQYRSNTPQ